jgi:V/A-type H+-transporting ATPase subunit C
MFLKDSTGFPENYGYLNARLRAHFSDFLGREDYRRIASRSLEGIELFLLETRYGKSFRKSLVEQPLSTHRRIEMALSDTASDSLNHARQMAMGEPEDLMRVLLARADLHNGRLLLRYFFTGAVYEGNPVWHGYGSLPVPFFRQLWKSHSLSHAIDKCLSSEHPLSSALAAGCSHLRKGSTLPASERVFLSEVLSSLEEILNRHRNKNGNLVRELLGRSIDIWNMNIWSRVAADTIDREKAFGLFIEGGFSLPLERLRGSNNVSQLLGATVWESLIPKDSGSPLVMMPGKAGRLFWLWQISQRRKDPLGIEVSIAFIAHQLVEWQNLNALVVGVDMGLEVGSIMGKMVLPG